jgi:hypothetical protein
MHQHLWLDERSRKLKAKGVFPALVVQCVVKTNCSIERCFAGIHLAEPQSQRDGRTVVILPVDGCRLVSPAPVAPTGVVHIDGLKRQYVHIRGAGLTGKRPLVITQDSPQEFLIGLVYVKQ